MRLQEDPNLPDAATAQKLVKEFEGISNTDEAFAQFCLQVRQPKMRKASCQGQTMFQTTSDYENSSDILAG